MRLIDADELKKYVKTVEDYESAYTINGIIDNAPTVNKCDNCDLMLLEKTGGEEE